MNAVWSRWRSQWRQAVGLKPGTPEKGFLGDVPYVFLVRIFILVGATYRLWPLLHVKPLAAAFLFILLIGASTSLFRVLRIAKGLQFAVVLADLVIISALLRLRGTPDTDFYLFYYLPIFSAAEYLDRRFLKHTILLSVMCFAGVLVCFQVSDWQRWGGFKLWLDNFLPRATFFVLATGVLADYYRRASDQQERAERRESEAAAFLELKEQLDPADKIEEVCRITCLKVRSLLKVDKCSVMVFPDKPDAIRDATVYSLPKGYEAAGLVNYALEQIREGKRGKDETFRHEGAYLGGVLAVAIARRRKILGGLACVAPAEHDLDDAKRSLFLTAQTAATAIERIRLRSLLENVSTAGAGALQLESAIDRILDETMQLGFEFASVSLVDEFRRTIEMIRGRNVPRGWREQSRHALDAEQPDIQAWVVKEQKSEFIAGWDEKGRLNRGIFDRYGHARVARVWAPILVDGEAVGTISAGCRIERANFVKQQLGRVEEVAERNAQQAGRNRPEVLLKRLATEVLDVVYADVASIHIQRGDGLRIQAGAGFVDKHFITKHPPRSIGEGGIGAEALEKQEPVLLREEEIRRRRPDLAEHEGVRELAAFPFTSEKDKGVVYLLRRTDEEFGEAEQAMAKAFTAAVGAVIHNYFQLWEFSTQLQDVRAMGRLQHVVQEVAWAPDRGRLLEQIAQIILFESAAENVILYQRSKGHFTGPVMKDFASGSELRPEIYSSQDLETFYRVSSARAAGRACVFRRAAQDTPVEVNDILSGNSYLDQLDIGAISVIPLSLPGGSTGGEEGALPEVLGMLIVHHKSSEFRWDRPTIEAFASSAALAIRAARFADGLERDLERHSREILVLRDVAASMGGFSGQVVKLEDLVWIILEKARDVIKAQFGALMWVDAGRNELVEYKGLYSGEEAQSTVFRQPIDKGVLGLVAKDRSPRLVHDVNAPEWKSVYIRRVPGMRSELAVPILDGDRLLGIYNVEHPLTAAFTEDDQRVLQSLSFQAVAAWRLADLTTELGEKERPWRSFGRLAVELQDPKHRFDTVLRLLLTGLTHGAGLGYSRAILFLPEERSQTVSGKMAIGPQTLDEAKLMWHPEKEHGAEDFEADLKRAIDFEELVASRTETDRPLSVEAQKLTFRLTELPGALGAAWQSGKTQAVAANADDAFRSVWEKIAAGDRARAFACVPLRSGGKVIGALVVDHRYKEGREDANVWADDEFRLKTFGELASLAIRNALLGRKMAADYEHLVHQIKAPVNLIKNYARELDEKFRNASPEIRTQILSMHSQCKRVEHMASSLKLMAELTTGTSVALKCKPVSGAELRGTLEWMLSTYEDFIDPTTGVRFHLNGAGFPDWAWETFECDLPLIEQVIGNVLDNASKYSNPDTEIRCQTSLTDGVLVLTISNESVAITQEDLPRVGSRGWRSRAAQNWTAEGAGLGLYIAKHIMRAHGGDLSHQYGEGRFEVSISIPTKVQEPNGGHLTD